MSVSEVFRRITAALDQAGITYMLSGSFASTFYGAPRSTQDIDFVIDATPEQVRRFAEGLPSEKYYVDPDAALEAHRRRSMFNVIDLATGWKIDLIIRKTREFSQEEFRRRQRVAVQGVPVFVATAEDAIISKLEWSKWAQSQRHIEDVAGILRLRWPSLDRPYLEKWIVQLGLDDQWTQARSASGIPEQ